MSKRHESPTPRAYLMIYCSNSSSSNPTPYQARRPPHFSFWIGLGKIYTEADIAKARESPSFPREYCGEYIGEQGDAFSYESIEQVVQSGLALEEHFPTSNITYHQRFKSFMLKNTNDLISTR